MQSKRWCCLCAGLLSALFFGIILLVYLVDPYEIYHRALFYQPPYNSGTQIYSNAGVARSFDYDSIILGSSVTENCMPSVYDAALGGRFVKLCVNGGFSADHASMMETAFASRPLSRVVYGLDIFAYSAYYNNHTLSIPKYLYTSSVLDDTAYWFNRGVLLSAIPEALSNLGTPNEDRDRDRMYSWDPPEVPGADALLSRVDLVSPLPEQPVDVTMLEFAQLCAEHNLLAFIRAHRDTQFDIFFPPYPLIYWVDYVRGGRFETALAQKKCLMQLLVREPNVTLHDFQTNTDWVSDLSLYYDLIHYLSSVNDAMAEAMAKKQFIITDEGQINAQIDTLRQDVCTLFETQP